MNKYGVIVSNEKGEQASIEVTDISLAEAERIASANNRVDCLPVGRAYRSFVNMDGTGKIWSVVASTKNRPA